MSVRSEFAAASRTLVALTAGAPGEIVDMRKIVDALDEPFAPLVLLSAVCAIKALLKCIAEEAGAAASTDEFLGALLDGMLAATDDT